MVKYDSNLSPYWTHVRKRVCQAHSRYTVFIQRRDPDSEVVQMRPQMCTVSLCNWMPLTNTFCCSWSSFWFSRFCFTQKLSHLQFCENTFFSFLRIDLLKRFFIKRRTNVHTTLQHYDLVLTNWHFWELSSNRQTRKTKCTKDLLVQRDMSPFPTFSIYLLITICVSTGNANSLRCFVVVIIHCFYAWSIFNIVLS